jgi:hypothetical protein
MRCESASARVYVECCGAATGQWVEAGVKLGVMNDIGRGKGDAGGLGWVELGGSGGGEVCGSREKAREECVGIVSGVRLSSGEEVTKGLAGVFEVHNSIEGLVTVKCGDVNLSTYRRMSNTPTKMKRTEMRSHSMTDCVALSGRLGVVMWIGV